MADNHLSKEALDRLTDAIAFISQEVMRETNAKGVIISITAGVESMLGMGGMQVRVNTIGAEPKQPENKEPSYEAKKEAARLLADIKLKRRPSPPPQQPPQTQG